MASITFWGLTASPYQLKIMYPARVGLFNAGWAWLYPPALGVVLEYYLQPILAS